MRIPNISRQTYDLANLCAISLWNGTDYETGKKQLVSDAYLLQKFGIKFINAKINNSLMSFSLDEISEFIKVAKLRHRINPLSVDLFNGNRCLNTSILTYATQQSHRRLNTLKYEVGATMSENLGRHFSTKRFVIRNGKRIRTRNNKTTLASRLLFFTVPSEQCFNLNEDVAKNLYLKGKTALTFNREYCEALATLLDRDWHILSNFKMPLKNNDISPIVWNEAYKGCWWQRRVLDLAVLLHYKLASPIFTSTYSILVKPKLPNLFKKI
jgi:hypothetical protein